MPPRVEDIEGKEGYERVTTTESVIGLVRREELVDPKNPELGHFYDITISRGYSLGPITFLIKEHEIPPEVRENPTSYCLVMVSEGQKGGTLFITEFRFEPIG